MPEDRVMPIAAERATSLRIRAVETLVIDTATLRTHKLANNNHVRGQSFVVVRLTLENGVQGFGEASSLGGPRWAEESPETIASVIAHYLAPALLEQSAGAFESNALRMAAAAQRNYAAKAALECAALDAVARSLNVAMCELLGGATRDRFSAIWALASGDPEQEVEEARGKIECRQFRRFKIKIGLQPPARELERLCRIRAGLGDDIELIVDANQAWSEADCIRFIPRLAELDIALLEQPLPGGQMAALGRISQRSPVPIMVDESVFSAEDMVAAGAQGAGSVMSLKLVKSGGPFALKRVAAIAEAQGYQLYGGCLLESSIGAAAHLAAFATLPRLAWGTEHFGPLILENDLVTDGLRYADFAVHLPVGPGLGVTPDWDSLKLRAR
ncbi:muconate/chloromuconate family cycloisomerase [Algiphilus sp.]|uniref:muconate/chloromuconate family cycloisomerase n=1 Tax=Algiphilus sp. TaxID=1872431 RepID=UPI003BACB80F